MEKTDKEIFCKMLLNAKIDAKVYSTSFIIERGYSGFCVDVTFHEDGSLKDIAAFAASGQW